MSENSAMEKLVSVIIPLFNHEKYIIECLNSIKQQTYNNFEIIIIDDGSKDNSAKNVENWIKENPIINIKFIKQNNIGICKTLNKLISLAKGDYIAMIASDDSLVPNSLEVRIKYLEKYTKYSAVIGDAFLMNEKSEIISDSAMQKLYDASYSNLLKDINTELVLNWSIPGPVLLLKKEVFDKIGCFDESLIVEDRDFYLRLIIKDELVFIPEKVAKYRIVNNKKSHKSIFFIWREIAKANIKYKRCFKGIKGIFMISHEIDYMLCRFKYSEILFVVIYILRKIRKIITILYRLIYFKRNSYATK